MNRRKLEAIAEAIMKFSGYLNPESSVYQARNPGGLKAFMSHHERDEYGNRVFSSVLNGMSALLSDLELKLTKRMSPNATLIDLASAYNQPFTAAQAWSKFLRHALVDESITHKTPLSYFLTKD